MEVLEACIDGRLDKIDLSFEDNAAVCVILASDGYPGYYEKGLSYRGLDSFRGADDYFVFHAATKNEGGQILTNGGRVLGLTAIASDLKKARAKAYEAVDRINFANKYMRKDIGRVIDQVED